MLIFGMISAFLIILVILFLFLKFSVILSIKNGALELRIKVFGIKLKISLPVDKKQGEKKEKPRDENSVMKKFMDFRNEFNRKKSAISNALGYLRYKIEIHDVCILGDFGTGNAATTGIAYGSVQMLAGGISSLIGQYFTLEKPLKMNVALNFEKPVFEMSFHASITARPVHLLVGGLKFLKNK